MNTALSLLRDAFVLVACRPLTTLKVIAPAVVLMCVVGLFAALNAPELLTLDPAQPDLSNIDSASLGLVLLMAFVLAYALMAILWHRHTLGADHTSGKMGARLVLGYLWRVLALAVIQLVAGLLLVIPLVAANQTGSGPVTAPSLPSIILTTFITQLLLLWLSLRLSLILPAAALGRTISMADSWRHTIDLSRQIWGVAAALACLNAGLTALITYFSLTQPVYALALELPIYILEGLLIFSVLTTLYARLVRQAAPDI